MGWKVGMEVVIVDENGVSIRFIFVGVEIDNLWNNPVIV